METSRTDVTPVVVAAASGSEEAWYEDRRAVHAAVDRCSAAIPAEPGRAPGSGADGLAAAGRTPRHAARAQGAADVDHHHGTTRGAAVDARIGPVPPAGSNGRAVEFVDGDIRRAGCGYGTGGPQCGAARGTFLPHVTKRQLLMLLAQDPPLQLRRHQHQNGSAGRRDRSHSGPSPRTAASHSRDPVTDYPVTSAGAGVRRKAAVVSRYTMTDPSVGCHGSNDQKARSSRHPRTGRHAATRSCPGRAS